MRNALHPAPLSEQKEFYEAQSYLVVRGVFGRDDVADMSADAARLVERRELMQSDNLRCRWQNRCESEACMFDAFDPVIDLSPACDQVAHDFRLMAILASIYGGPA